MDIWPVGPTSASNYAGMRDVAPSQKAALLNRHDSARKELFEGKTVSSASEVTNAAFVGTSSASLVTQENCENRVVAALKGLGAVQINCFQC